MRALEPHGRAMVYMIISFVLSTFVLVSSSRRWPGIADGVEPFDEHLAREIVNLTEAAYCADKLVDWDCEVCKNFPGMTNVTVLQGKSRNVRGFVGIDTGGNDVDGVVGVDERGDEIQNGAAQLVFLPPDSSSSSSSTHQQQAAGDMDTAATRSTAEMAVTATDRRRHLRARTNRDDATGPTKPKVVITFSGTDPKSIKNWIDDLEAAPTAHVYGDECQECKVHRGFLAAYAIVQDQIRAAVAGHLQHNPTAKILITGHSLGGALATLCFLDLEATLSAEAVSFAPLYIYGAPRVGNAAFATYSASRGVPIFRVVHNRDPVPHLPFEAWGYVHPPREVFFDSPQESYVVCDETGEDATCSDQFWVMPGLAHVGDHLAYLEVDYTKAYLTCLLGEGGQEEEEVEEMEEDEEEEGGGGGRGEGGGAGGGGGGGGGDDGRN